MKKYEEAIHPLELYLKNYPEGDRVNEAEKGIQMAKEQLKEKTSVPLPVSEPAEKKFLPEVKKAKRRICAQVSYFEGKSLEEVEKRVKDLKDAGGDRIILRVFQNKGDRKYKFVTAHHEEGVYFKTEYAPVVDDILGKVSEIVHQNGLELFAWMTTVMPPTVWMDILNIDVRVIISKQKKWKWRRVSIFFIPMSSNALRAFSEISVVTRLMESCFKTI